MNGQQVTRDADQQGKPEKIFERFPEPGPRAWGRNVDQAIAAVVGRADPNDRLAGRHEPRRQDAIDRGPSRSPHVRAIFACDEVDPAPVGQVMLRL